MAVSTDKSKSLGEVADFDERGATGPTGATGNVMEVESFCAFRIPTARALTTEAPPEFGTEPPELAIVDALVARDAKFVIAFNAVVAKRSRALGAMTLASNIDAKTSVWIFAEKTSALFTAEPLKKRQG